MAFEKDIVTDKLYGEQYVENIVGKDWRYETIPLLVERTWEYFSPQSVIDIGCANGLHMKHFMEKGCNVMGIEGSSHFAKHIQENAWYADYLIHDIRKPFDLGRKYDLAICIEVLEHLEEKYADIAVKNICNHAHSFLITASDIPKPKMHINAQKKKYWVQKFESIARIKYMHEETLNFQSVMDDYGNHVMNKNMKKNLMIFRDLNVYPELKREAKFKDAHGRPRNTFSKEDNSYFFEDRK